jgi:hypothetical protein
MLYYFHQLKEGVMSFKPMKCIPYYVVAVWVERDIGSTTVMSWKFDCGTYDYERAVASRDRALGCLPKFNRNLVRIVEVCSCQSDSDTILEALAAQPEPAA